MRLRPFDSTTSQGRAQERHRRILLTVLASALARGVSVLTALLPIPFVLAYLGTERYGLWSTVNSFVILLAFSDLGMGNGLLNAVSEAHGKDDQEAALRYVSSTFFALGGLAVILLSGFTLLYRWIPWPRIFNVSSPAATAEAGPAMAVFVGLFLISLPLSISQRVQLGYQEGFRNSLWEGLGNLVGLVGVLLGTYLRAGLPWLVLARTGGLTLTALLNSLILFSFTRPWLRPRWGHVTAEAVKKILRLGLLFFILQLTVALAFASDNLVAAQVLGPEAVTQYSIPAQLFNIIPAILLMMLNPLWPAYGEAIARRDIAWVKRTLGRSLLLSALLTGLPALLLVIFGAPLVTLWVGPKVTPSFLLLLGLGVWMMMQTLGNAVAMFLNGASVVKFQMIIAVVMASSALIAKILLARWIGVPGVIWGTVIAYSAFVAAPCIILVPRLLSTMAEGRSAPVT